MARKKGEQGVAKKPVRTRKATEPARGTTQTTTTAAKSQARESVMPYTEAQIRERAYYIYLERGGTVGDPLTDWLQAEQELNGLERKRGRAGRMTREPR